VRKKKPARKAGARKPRGRRKAASSWREHSVAAKPVTAAELDALRRELDRKIRTRRSVPRWNPDPEEVERSVAQLVLTIVEFLRKLMERQAIRRMDERTLTPREVEAVGLALMRLEATVRDIGRRFGLNPADLNIDLGPTKLM
jgi:hypothetical protein